MPCSFKASAADFPPPHPDGSGEISQSQLMYVGGRISANVVTDWWEVQFQPGKINESTPLHVRSPAFSFPATTTAPRHVPLFIPPQEFTNHKVRDWCPAINHHPHIKPSGESRQPHMNNVVEYIILARPINFLNLDRRWQCTRLVTGVYGFVFVPLSSVIIIVGKVKSLGNKIVVLCTNLSPAVISIAPLKLPIFQQVRAARKRHA